MNLFEYEGGRLEQTSSALGAAVLVFALFMMFLFWLILGGLFVKIGVHQTSAFLTREPEIAGKLAAYESISDVDMVFIGSSRIHRHVIPEIIQKQCQKNVFNLGIGGQSSAGTKFVLNWVLAKRKLPERIWVEPQGADGSFNEETMNSDRILLYSPLWPNDIWNDRYIHSNSSDATIFWNQKKIIFNASMKSYFSLGVFWLLNPTAADTAETINAYQDAIFEKGFYPLDYMLPKESGRRRELSKILNSEPHFQSKRFTEAEQRFVQMSRDDIQRSIEKDVDVILKDLSIGQLSRIGLIYAPGLLESQYNVKKIVYRNVEIPIISFPASTNSFIGDSKYWIDRGHFKKAGAIMLSKSISKQICE